MPELHEKYATQNLAQGSEPDSFTRERYVQFHRFIPKHARSILDVGAGTGRGGQELAKLEPDYQLMPLDCVQSRLDVLPKCYGRAICALSNAIPAEDQSFDVIVAGEFLEHLYPSDVDPTLCEFQRVLKLGGRLLMTTPNPDYLRLWLSAQADLGGRGAQRLIAGGDL
jgi:ubiquinone/menaquinone biosynthesis C-methylase UbiE